MNAKIRFVWAGRFFGFIWLLFGMSACNSALLVNPQVPVGGLNSYATDESPSYSGDGRYLAFASDRSGRRSLYLFDLQERRLVNLPNLNRRDSSQDQPALNADGRFIAYVSSERGKSDVMVYDRQSGRSELLTANVRGTVRNPTLSGDGRKVAFETNQSGQWNIAIVERNYQ
jgi:Tol biopolymer transport system component